MDTHHVKQQSQKAAAQLGRAFAAALPDDWHEQVEADEQLEPLMNRPRLRRFGNLTPKVALARLRSLPRPSPSSPLLAGAEARCARAGRRARSSRGSPGRRTTSRQRT